jgi:tRNA threonylcarbamoyladenosine biosynthesis protein TsaE
MEIIVPNQDELIALGRWWGESLTGNEVIALSGPLGAGKTTFVKGMAAGLGITETILSPTFVLVLEYRGKHSLYHFDWYRIDSQKEVEDLGFWDFLEKPGIKVIEWPEKFAKLVPGEAKWIRIEIQGSNRKVTW